MAEERKEEFEVRHNPRFLRRSMSLASLQKEGRRKEFGREQKEKEAREHKERPEISRNPRPFRHSTTLIPWRREKRREELERGKKEKGAEEAATKAKETLKEKVLKSVQTKPRPTTPDICQAVGAMTRMPPLWLVLVAGSTLTNYPILRLSPLQKPAEAPGDWTLTKLMKRKKSNKRWAMGTMRGGERIFICPCFPRRSTFTGEVEARGEIMYPLRMVMRHVDPTEEAVEIGSGTNSQLCRRKRNFGPTLRWIVLRES